MEALVKAYRPTELTRFQFLRSQQADVGTNRFTSDPNTTVRLLGRLKRDFPEIAKQYREGKFKSALAARQDWPKRS
jgi:hypothetical protein